MEFSWTRRNAADWNRIRIRIEHAEPALRCTPNLARTRIYQLIGCVVPEMVVVMTRSKLKQSVVGSHVIIRIADEDVLISGIRRHHRKPHERAQAGFDL